MKNGLLFRRGLVVTIVSAFMLGILYLVLNYSLSIDREVSVQKERYHMVLGSSYNIINFSKDVSKYIKENPDYLLGCNSQKYQPPEQIIACENALGIKNKTIWRINGSTSKCEEFYFIKGWTSGYTSNVSCQKYADEWKYYLGEGIYWRWVIAIFRVLFWATLLPVIGGSFCMIWAALRALWGRSEV